ncbi:MAG: exonuclease subunit SbcD [Candidatus Babeliales bacterium]
MIQFFHTADIHLGVENYGKTDAKTGMHSRLSDFANSLEECINLAIKKNIDFFLFCGDAYKTAWPTPTQQKILIELFLKLQKNNIPIVIIIGNHDHPLSFGKANSLDIFGCLPLPEFHVITKPQILKLKTKNGLIQIVGIPWPTRNNIISTKYFNLKNNDEITQYLSQAIGDIIKNFASQLDENIPAILAGHLTVSSGIFSGSEKCAVFGNDPVFLPSQLAIKPFDYVALGHLHRHQNLNSKGYPAVVYSGSIERVDFGERNESKGFCHVKIDETKSKRCSFDFIKLNTRKMLQIEVELAGEQDQTEQILKELEKHDIQDAIIKIIYHIPENKKDKVDLQKIQFACSKAHFIAGLIPIKKITTLREKRISLKIDMDFTTILDKFLDTKNLSKDQKENLFKKAQYIYDQAKQETDPPSL